MTDADFNSAEAFTEAFTEQIEQDSRRTGVEPADFRVAGRASKAWPNKEDITWWASNGPVMVDDYIAWKENVPWDIWTTPDGEPGIEVSTEVQIAGIPVRGFIDRVYETADGELVIVDLKTGSRTPDSPLQLGFYKVMLEKQFGVTADQGAYYLARRGGLTPLYSLAGFTEELLGGWLKKFELAVEHEIYLPHLTAMCSGCGVRKFCDAYQAAFPSDPVFLNPLGAS